MKKAEVSRWLKPQRGSVGIWILWIVLTILIAGGLVYYFQFTKIPDLNTKISDLQSQITQLQANQNQQSSTTDATADWKTFTNSTYGYSFKYPKTLAPTTGVSKDSLVILSNNGNGKWVFQIATVSTTKTLQQNVATEKTSKESDGYTVISKTATVDSRSATTLTLSGSEAETTSETLVVKNGKLYTISLSLPTDEDQLTMLSTFQFTD